MATAERIQIVGIGDDGPEGLTASARELIDGAEILVGAESLLRLIPDSKARRVEVGANLDEVVAVLSEHDGARAVILVSGDPLFYGLARYLCQKLGKERFEVVPHVSSMQLAFARVKESWEEAYLTNLAARPLESVIDRIRVAEKVGLFTSDACPPRAIARALLERHIDYFSGYVCENLGSPDERVTQGELAELAEQDFSPLNVMVLVRKPDVPDRPREMLGKRLFGNADDTFLQSQPKSGLLTPAEVRSLALAELDIGPSSVVWDVGAGSGSVAIEAAQLAQQGQVFAIEMDTADHELIIANSERFGLSNLVAIHGKAPAAWENLTPPDAIFVGGSGREVSRVVDAAYTQLKVGGRLVANVGSIENLAAVHDILHRRGPDVQVWMINIARGTYQLERVRFEALNPSFLLAVVKS